MAEALSSIARSLEKIALLHQAIYEDNKVMLGLQVEQHAMLVRREKSDAERLEEIRKIESETKAKQAEYLAEEKHRFDESKKNEREMLRKMDKMTEDGDESWKDKADLEKDESSEEKAPPAGPEFDGQDYG